MAPLESEPCPVMLAKQRARAAIAFSVVAFVAVGAVAWIGLEAVRSPTNPEPVYSSAPPADTVQQLLIALKAQQEREDKQARLALLSDQDDQMVVKPSESAVELTQIDRELSQAEASLEPEVTQEPITIAAVEPEVTPTVESVVEAELVSAPEPVVEITEATSCIDDLREMAQGHTIHFGVGSADLEGSELPILRKIGRLTVDCPEAMIHVTGHSDSSGSDIINLALSWQRADNTVAALAALGVDTAQFEPVGFGARSPSAQGDSTDEELNRRVEFVVLQSVH